LLRATQGRNDDLQYKHPFAGTGDAYIGHLAAHVLALLAKALIIATQLRENPCFSADTERMVCAVASREDVLVPVVWNIWISDFKLV
jgi:hypothetical protein